MRSNVTIFVPDGNVEQALGSFKKKMLTSGTFAEIKKREAGYMPPSERRRRKSELARKKLRKAAKKKAEYEERNEDRKSNYTPPTWRSTDGRSNGSRG